MHCKWLERICWNELNINRNLRDRKCIQIERCTSNKCVKHTESFIDRSVSLDLASNFYGDINLIPFFFYFQQNVIKISGYIRWPIIHPTNFIYFRTMGHRRVGHRRVSKISIIIYANARIPRKMKLSQWLFKKTDKKIQIQKLCKPKLHNECLFLWKWVILLVYRRYDSSECLLWNHFIQR